MRMEPAELLKTFNPLAPAFDDLLVKMLDYRGPEVVAALLELHGDPRGARVLDLGCGTGLVGAILKERGAALIDGVELSPEMRRRLMDVRHGAYDRVILDDVTTFQPEPEFYTVVTCADVAPYLGELDGLFAVARTALGRNGLFILTVEDSIGSMGQFFQNPDTHRFTHDYRYLDETATAAGFVEVGISFKSLRRETNCPVPSITMAMRRG